MKQRYQRYTLAKNKRESHFLLENVLCNEFLKLRFRINT